MQRTSEAICKLRRPWRRLSSNLKIRKKFSRQSAPTAAGYYEWKLAPEGKQPYFISAADGSPLLADLRPLPPVSCARASRASPIQRGPPRIAETLKAMGWRTRGG